MSSKKKPNNDPDSVALRMKLKQQYLPDRYPAKEAPMTKESDDLHDQFTQQASIIEKRNNYLIEKIEQYRKNVK